MSHRRNFIIFEKCIDAKFLNLYIYILMCYFILCNTVKLFLFIAIIQFVISCDLEVPYETVPICIYCVFKIDKFGYLPSPEYFCMYCCNELC